MEKITSIANLLDIIHLSRQKLIQESGKDGEIIIIHPIHKRLLLEKMVCFPLSYDQHNGELRCFGIKTIFSSDIKEDEVIVSSYSINLNS